MTVTSAQRFTRQRPCPVCGGFDQAPRGQTKRCYGFLSDDGLWAHCTRPEYAGSLPMDDASQSWVHRLVGGCRCGQRHELAPTDSQPSINGKGPGNREIVATYDYRDADGTLLFQVVGYRPKAFKQRRPGPNGEWIWNLEGVTPVLYRLSELLAADRSKSVFITEGEKHADRLIGMGLVATTFPMGAGKSHLVQNVSGLKDRHVVVLPDKDPPGHRHGHQVANRLWSIAKSVRLLELPGLRDNGGDVLDWLEAGHTTKELLALVEAAPEWRPPETQAPVNHLRFRSAAEVARETSDSVPWIAEPWVALGSLTELDGKIKAGGKTTWLLALCRKVLVGQPFMGLPTMKTPIVFLTEQPMSSFREALRRAHLLDREDFRVLPYHDTMGTPWPQVVEAAKQECLRIGAKLLGVDTLPQFAGIRGDNENSSGATLEALEPIQGVVALGIGVFGVRHDRKAGGDVGDSGRGSSAWGGVADTIISIRRGDGNSSPTTRILQALSRFDGPPDKLVIDLQDGEYVALGTETKVAEQRARTALWKAMPESEEYAKSRDELIKAAEVKATVGKDVINKWDTDGHLGKSGKGVANNPERFWKLDIGRSEPPVVANDRHTHSTDAGQDDGSKVGRSVYRDAVATDRHSSVAAVTDGGQETPAGDPDDASPSRSVGTPTLNSDRPTSEDSSEDVLEVA